MPAITRKPYFSIFSIICGAWFCLTGWFWAWLANVLFSFPFAIIGLILWYVGKRTGESPGVNRAAGILLLLGLVLSLGALAMFTLFN